MTANSTLKWVIYLNDIVKSYNNTPIRRLNNFSPNEATVSPSKEFLKQKFKEEREHMYEKYKNGSDLKVNDFVRVVKPKTVFSRGYKASFYDKVRKITKVLATAPPTFKILGLQRSYYRAELAPTCESTVEKEKFYYITKERKIGGRQLRSGEKIGQEKQFLIKSYSDLDFEKWVDEQEIKKLHHDKLLCNFDLWS